MSEAFLVLSSDFFHLSGTSNFKILERKGTYIVQISYKAIKFIFQGKGIKKKTTMFLRNLDIFSLQIY